MSLFHKKLDDRATREFFLDAYKNTLSTDEMNGHREKLELIKETFPILKKVSQAIFDKNLTEVNLALLELEWARYWYPKIDGSLGIEFNEKLNKELEAALPELNNYDVESYAEEFRNASTQRIAGNVAMAIRFCKELMNEYNEEDANNFDESNIQEIISFFTNQFFQTHKIYIRMFKQARLIK